VTHRVLLEEKGVIPLMKEEGRQEIWVDVMQKWLCDVSGGELPA